MTAANATGGQSKLYMLRGRTTLDAIQAGSGTLASEQEKAVAKSQP